MQKDCEVYVDPEEDEVFFGCVSEREKSVSAKLVNPTGSSPKDDQIINQISDLDENRENILNNEPSNGGILINESDKNEANQDLNKTFTNNTTVELEHNYSTPMKHKIDKTILTTPKSIVKADRDGGFLKVLSEIALVKAEAEGDKKKEDEDKENQMIQPVPVIKVTEATPEKQKVVSPPKTMASQLRRFRIIYNSPQSDESVRNFENNKNLKNKSLDEEVKEPEIVLSEKRDSIDLIDFEKSIVSNDISIVFEKVNGEEQKPLKSAEDEKCEKVEEEVKPEPPKEKEKKPEIENKLPAGYRFSKEARKIVEVLKKSAVNDTLDFTIDEIDVENVDNSLISPEPVSLDVTVLQKPQNPEVVPRKIEILSKTVEKDRHKATPVLSQSKIQSVKYFSERKLGVQPSTGVKKCVKKLPLEEKRPATEEKPKGGRMAEKETPSSRIPVFGVKNSRIPLHAGAPRPVTSKTISTPSGKTLKNPKYKNIESPINAYIHNKPTSLVLNVKPEVKKGPLSRIWRPEIVASGKKPEEKKSKSETKPVRLPFVEYRSATPYEIEKRPESRLPRLAPTVQKLIGGSHSPRVLRHEGRFFVNSPRKKDAAVTAEDTILADPCEVSLVVSQSALKSAR